MLASTADILGIIGVVLSFLLVTLSGLIVYIFKDLRDDVKMNTRHMESLLNNDTDQQWRLTFVEDHLEKTTEFRPIRDRKRLRRKLRDEDDE